MKIPDSHALLVSRTEREYGKRGTHRVYYLRNGKMTFDVEFLPEADACEKRVMWMAREAFPRSTIELVGSIALDQSVSVVSNQRAL